MSASGLGLRIGTVWLLSDVSLDLVAGRVVAVVGPNGAGKSTLLSLLAGDLEPTTGAVRVGEMAVARSHPIDLARRRAVLPQQPTIAFPFTVADVVEMGRMPWAGTDAEDEDERAVDDALDTMQMGRFAFRRVPTLSGGERARASFARILAQRCGILLLDEPTASLDLRHQEHLMATVRARAGQGDAVLVVLHDLQLAAAYADEIAVLHAGRLVAHGAPEDVLTRALLEGVYEVPIDVTRHPASGELLIGPRRGGVA